MKLSGYRSPLGSMQAIRPDTEKIKREAWNEDGWLVIHRDDPDLHGTERQTIEAIGNRKFGKMKGCQ